MSSVMLARSGVLASLVAMSLELGATNAFAQAAPPPPTYPPPAAPAAAPPPLAPSPLVEPQAPPPAYPPPGYPPPGYPPPPPGYYGYQYAPAYEPPPPPPRKPKQRNDVVMLSYDTAVGIGKTHDFAGQFSFLGFAADWRTRVTDNFWPGFTFGWQVLYDKKYETRTYKEVTFTGTLATSLNAFPLLASADYFFMTDRRGIRPYAGLGVGAYAAERRIDVSIWTIQDTTWHFGFAPEIGVALPTGEASAFVAVKYNYAFASGGWPEIMYMNFNIGVEL
jgi:hypothetical protein